MVYLSSISTMRSLCTCLIVMGTFLYCDVQLSIGYIPHQGKAIEYIVSYVLFFYNLTRIAITVYIQLVHREELVGLINQLLSTKTQFERFFHIERFHDQKLSNHLRNRRICLGIQFVSLISSITIYMYRTLFLNNFCLVMFCYVAVIYMNLLATLTTGIYYNGSMILVDRFYRILISRLKFLLLIVEKKVNSNQLLNKNWIVRASTLHHSFIQIL